MQPPRKDGDASSVGSPRLPVAPTPAGCDLESLRNPRLDLVRCGLSRAPLHTHHPPRQAMRKEMRTSAALRGNAQGPIKSAAHGVIYSHARGARRHQAMRAATLGSGAIDLIGGLLEYAVAATAVIGTASWLPMDTRSTDKPRRPRAPLRAG
eukprot:334998-Chlamydomonas_euryale.AAC.6